MRLDAATIAWHDPEPSQATGPKKVTHHRICCRNLLKIIWKPVKSSANVPRKACDSGITVRPSDTWERCTPPPYLHGRRLLKPGESQNGTAPGLASENAAKKNQTNAHKSNENSAYRLNTDSTHNQKTYNIYRLKSNKRFSSCCAK